MKEHDRREHLKTLNDEERKKEEEHYEEMRKKHADHPKVNHPVSDSETVYSLFSAPMQDLLHFPFINLLQTCFFFNFINSNNSYFNMNSNERIISCCRGVRINLRKCGRRQMVWTQKILIQKPSSIFMVNSSAVSWFSFSPA